MATSTYISKSSPLYGSAQSALRMAGLLTADQMSSAAPWMVISSTGAVSFSNSGPSSHDTTLTTMGQLAPIIPADTNAVVEPYIVPPIAQIAPFSGNDQYYGVVACVPDSSIT